MQGPIDALKTHLADPWGANFATNGVRYSWIPHPANVCLSFCMAINITVPTFAGFVTPYTSIRGAHAGMLGIDMQAVTDVSMPMQVSIPFLLKA